MAEVNPTQIKMGLGEAIRRLMTLEFQVRNGTAAMPKAALAERGMILESLNHFELSLGFDCNADGVPDTVEIFERSVKTSCCRLMPADKKGDGSRARKLTDSQKQLEKALKEAETEKVTQALQAKLAAEEAARPKPPPPPKPAEAPKPVEVAPAPKPVEATEAPPKPAEAPKAKARGLRTLFRKD